MLFKLSLLLSITALTQHFQFSFLYNTTKKTATTRSPFPHYTTKPLATLAESETTAIYTRYHGEAKTTPSKTTATTTTSKGSCEAPIYNVFVQYSNADNLAACLLNSAITSNCKYWRISVLLLLDNNWYSRLYLQQIQYFLNGVTQNCDKRSTLQIFDPGRSLLNQDCETVKIGTVQQKNLVSGMSLDETYTSSGMSSGDQLDKLLEQLHTCVVDNPLANDEAGVVFVFTDVACTELCRSANLRSDAQPITDALVTKQRFVMKYMILSDDSSEASCVENLFTACHQMSSSLCDVRIYGNQTKQLNDVIGVSTTCRSTSNSSGNDDLTPAELIITIGVPCLCLTIICSVCAVFCYKKSKYSTRRWRRFWQSQSAFHHPEMTTNHHPVAQLPHPASLVMANQYMDIKALSEANKKDLWEVSLSNLYINENEILGNGAFAVVLKGTLKGKIPLLMVYPRLNICSEHVQDDGPCETAVKRLPSHANDQNRIDFYQEINFMKNLGYHAHVISMLGCISCPLNPMILVEYCEYGDLLRFLRKNRNHVLMNKDDVCPIDADLCLRIKDLVSIAWQVSDGMTYLSSMNFIHRDVAARNVLITKQLVAKVSDFGLGRYADSALYTARGGRLPFKSMALEALKFYEFSEKTDVWAFGILLFEVFSLGDVPYATVQPTDMISYIEQGNRPPQPEKCPNEIYNLMERCWKQNAEDRPTFAEIRGELTILLNIDDESYGYLSLESKQLRNMINRQITELHSTTNQDDDRRKEEKEYTRLKSFENILENSGRGNHYSTSRSSEQNDVTICPDVVLGTIIPTESTKSGTVQHHDLSTKLRKQSISEKPSSTANLCAEVNFDNDLAVKSTLKKNADDVTVFLETFMNLSRQMPDDKRTDCLLSIEEWMHNKISDGC